MACLRLAGLDTYPWARPWSIFSPGFYCWLIVFEAPSGMVAGLTSRLTGITPHKGIIKQKPRVL